MSFVHLHSHSYYSLLDGLRSPEAMVERAKAMGCPALGLTDHGVLYGAIDFYKAAKKAGIKPIIGCEMYMAQRTRFDKTSGVDNKPYHVTVLAKSYKGYQNLMQLVTKANLEGYYYKPRIDHALLGVYKEDLIVLSGCLNGEISRAILSDDMKLARETIQLYKDMLGPDHYYLEIQDNPLLEQQAIVNKAMIELAKEMDVPLVATGDSHYVKPEESHSHDILLSIQTGTNIYDENRMKFSGDFSMATPEQMMEAFKDTPEAITNTVKIADMCNIEIPFHQNLLPDYDTPNNEPADQYLRRLCFEGLDMRYGGKAPPEAVKQLEYELGIVHQMGFDTYFLIVWDFIKAAKEMGIVVGPGRGSAAGSLLSYSLNITQLNPLKYGLIFERFLNPERISMPDIDVDFADDRRAEVLGYVINKYGRENVAQIITFGTMASRAAVRDVGRALGYPYAEVDAVSKKIPPPVQGKNVPLVESLQSDPELKDLYAKDERARALLDDAMELEGTVRHAGTHACAVVISSKPLVEYTPLQFGAGGEQKDIVTQYSMKPIEEIGLLKMDFLGLKNLTIMEKALLIIKRSRGLDIELEKIPMDDANAFALLQKGDTTGVFQLESGGMRRYLKELIPTRFEDIIAMVALYRPGPMDWIPSYIKGKHQPDSVKYLDKSFETILNETYGVAVYQEQILQIAQQFSGYTLGEADILRKAVGKKILSMLEEQKEKFVKGAVEKGHTAKLAEEVFKDVIEPFAGYGFNKAHAACYAMIAYQTAYLKGNFPDEFMTALLMCDQGDMDRIAIEIEECESMGIQVLPPSINESDVDFTLVAPGKIRFGLSAIKGVGTAPVTEIIEIRKKYGTFTSIQNFAERVTAHLINKKLFMALAYCGALEELGERMILVENFERIVGHSKAHQGGQAQGQTGLFDDMGLDDAPAFVLAKAPPASHLDCLRWEKEYLGLYVSSHPLQGLRSYLAKKVLLTEKITKKYLGKSVQFCGLVTSPKKIFTKSGAYMMQFFLEDPTGRISAVVFPKSYSAFADKLKEDHIVMITGRIDLRRSEYNLTVDSVSGMSLESMIERAKESGLYKPEEKVKRQMIVAAPEEVKKERVRSEDEMVDEGHDGGEGSAPRAPGTSDSAASPKLGARIVEDTLIITLPHQTKPEMMNSLKVILLSHAGVHPVEMHLKNGSEIKKIRVPLQVSFEGTILEQIEALFQREKIG
jgi:DNA polymerase-3 subunit alpha